jgi:hypothetical protein
VCIRPLLALTAVLALCVPAFAKDCPVSLARCPRTGDPQGAVLQGGPGGDAILRLRGERRRHGDVTLGSAVAEVCEAGFLGKLSKAQRRSYDREMRRCDAKYRHESGTMYRSFEAFCRAELAVRYQTRMAKAPIHR